MDSASEGVTISTPAIHSSNVISFSRAKSCTCCTKLAITFRMRGDVFGPVALMTVWVKSGSKRWVLGVVLEGIPEPPSICWLGGLLSMPLALAELCLLSSGTSCNGWTPAIASIENFQTG